MVTAVNIKLCSIIVPLIRLYFSGPLACFSTGHVRASQCNRAPEDLQEECVVLEEEAAAEEGHHAARFEPTT